MQSSTQNREPEVEAEEPSKRKEASAGGAVPKRDSNLANIVGEWDDTDD
jgi:hypothetical protein